MQRKGIWRNRGENKEWSIKWTSHVKMAVGTLVWLSPISVSHVYVCCEDEMATTEGPPWVDFVPRLHLGMWVPTGAAGVEEVSVSAAGEVGGLSCWGGNRACLENLLLGGTGVGEMSRGFSTSSWSMTTCHSLCAWCCYLPHSGCVSHFLANFKLDLPMSRRHRVIRQAGMHPVIHGNLWVWSACEMCEWHMFAASTKLNQPGNRHSWDRQGGWDLGRGTGWDVHVLGHPGSLVCACTSDLLSLSAQEKERTWLPVPCTAAEGESCVQVLLKTVDHEQEGSSCHITLPASPGTSMGSSGWAGQEGS